MGDESGLSEAEMGNQHGPAKKKKHDTNGHADLSDQDYKYVSIVDVNPPSSLYDTASEDVLCQSIEVNSPDKNGEVLKCSVLIGEPPQENGHAVSRVSVNGEYDDFMDQVPNGSSSFIEKEDNHLSSFVESVPNGSSSFVDKVHNGLFLPIKGVDAIHNNNGLSNEKETNGLSSCVDLVSNGSNFTNHESNGSLFEHKESNGQPFLNGSSMYDHEFEESSLTSEGSFARQSLEEQLVLAVKQTLGSGVDGSLQEEVERVVREKLKRQRSGSSDYWNHEDSDDHCIVDFLDKINDHAEARLAAKRQARAEAREIRMRELERMQRESEDGDKVYDIYSTPDAVNRSVRAGSVATPRSLLSSNNSYHSSRRSSEDSLEEVNSIRDVRHELKELEEKFRKAMIANAQLDNEKAAVAYQVDLFKDRYEELEEQNFQLSREHKDTCRQLEMTKRQRTKLQEDLNTSHSQLSELLQLIQEKGLVVVEGDGSWSDEESEGQETNTPRPPKKALVSAEVADVLQQGSGSLDVRLKRYVEERNELVDELRRVKLQLEEERAHSRGRHSNGPTDDSDDVNREASKLLGDYKFKLQKAEQDVNTLQANVARLESQVVRYKSAAETSEKLEDELKLEKRKLQRELREAQARVEELETSHSHLQRRLDKLKNAKSALFKDL